MKNASWNYRLAGILTIAVAVLWSMVLPHNRETIDLIDNQELTASAFDAEPQYDPASLPVISPPANVASQPMVVAKATATTGNEIVEVQEVSVWGSVQTESGAVTYHDRVLFYSRTHNKSYSTFSDANGNFYIERMIPATDYSLWVMPAGLYRNYVRKNLVISAEQTEFAIILGHLPVANLSGHLVNADGNAVPDFGIKIRSSEKDTWAATFITDRFGYFQVDQVPLGALEFSSTYGPALRITGYEFSLNQQSPLVLVVDHGPYEINAMVFDQYDNPVAGANVVLNWLHTDDGKRSVVSRQSITNAAGQFSIGQLGSGEHSLVISALDGSTYQQEIDVNHLNSELTIFLRADS